MKGYKGDVMLILVKQNQNRREAMQGIERRSATNCESVALQGTANTFMRASKYHNSCLGRNKNGYVLTGERI